MNPPEDVRTSLPEVASATGDDFLSVAVRHGLLWPEQADQVRRRAERDRVDPSDAALTMDLLRLHEVEAVRLLASPTSLAPGYRLLELIGCGAAGMVFRAHHESLDRIVALKTINPSIAGSASTGQSRILREARSIAKLDHPGIVRAFDCGFYHGRFCIAMEYVAGSTIAQRIRRRGPAGPEETWALIRQVAEALRHALRHGIIHRDIKPGNLLVADETSPIHEPSDQRSSVPAVKVADFGLAKIASADDDATHLTATGATLGTPAYAAPEQLAGGAIDHRADIYGLGATAAHLMTGVQPYGDRAPMATVLAKTSGGDRWWSDHRGTVAEPSRRLIDRMLATAPEERPSDYDELIRDIDAVVSGTETSPSMRRRPSEPRTDVGNATRRSRTSSIAVAAASVGLVVGSAFTFRAFRPANVSGAATADASRFDGPTEPLFTGDSVPRWVRSGQWITVETPNGFVLRGGEGATARVPAAAVGPGPGSPPLFDAIASPRVSSDGRSEGRLRFRIWPDAGSRIELTVGNEKEVHAVAPEDSSTPIPRRVELRWSGDEYRFLIDGETVSLGRGSPDAVGVDIRVGAVSLSDVDRRITGVSRE